MLNWLRRKLWNADAVQLMVIDTIQDLSREAYTEIASKLDVERIANELDAYEIADQLDTYDIAQIVRDDIDVYEIAEAIDSEEVAYHVEVDAADVAGALSDDGNIIDCVRDEVLDAMDYDQVFDRLDIEDIIKRMRQEAMKGLHGATIAVEVKEVTL